MRWVILGPTELFVVLNQGQDYLEGYLAKKPRDEYDALEADLERIHYYGIRECCSKSKLYALPEGYQQAPAFGIRIELENPLKDNLIDSTVVATSLRRLSAISARGSVTDIALEAACQNNGIELFPANVEPTVEPDLTEILVNGVKHTETIVKPPNDLLLDMIGTRCLLTRLLVQRVISPVELLCSHYSSLMVVRNALDSMNEFPVRVPHEKVRPNMLVLVLWRATLHRGIVGAIFSDRELTYRVEFIDLPGHTESSLLYYVPSSIAHCAPRALMRVRLRKHVPDIDLGHIVTLLCDSVVDNTANGDLVQSESQTMRLNKSKL